MGAAQATRAVTLERRTDIDLESYRCVAREGAGIVIGEGAAERLPLNPSPSAMDRVV